MRRRVRQVRVLLGIIGLLVVAALGIAYLSLGRSAAPEPRTPNPEPLTVVATLAPLADWLREIGGPDVAVHCLVSGAADPHHFEPSISDAMQISNARAVFAVGLEMDPWAQRLV